jgi:hypothetical protein
MPYYSPIYGESSKKIGNNTLITSSTVYNQVPIDPYCGYQVPFEWYGIDADNISLLYENEEIYPSKIIISPVYLESGVHELESPMHGVTIETWYSLSENIDLNKTKVRSNYMGYLKNRHSPFKYETYKKNFSL